MTEEKQEKIAVPPPQPVPTVFQAIPVQRDDYRGVQINVYSVTGVVTFFAPIDIARHFSKLVAEAALAAEQAPAVPSGLIVPNVDMSEVLKHLPGNGGRT